MRQEEEIIIEKALSNEFGNKSNALQECIEDQIEKIIRSIKNNYEARHDNSETVMRKRLKEYLLQVSDSSRERAETWATYASFKDYRRKIEK
jgi:gas vesicle protein